jgi:hypothetical protein
MAICASPGGFESSLYGLSSYPWCRVGAKRPALQHRFPLENCKVPAATAQTRWPAPCLQLIPIIYVLSFAIELIHTD